MNIGNKIFPLVSVVVTTKNEERNIANCLSSVKFQDYPQEKIEIIVVDNSSVDDTKKIASQYTDKIYDCGPERSAQRNFGVEKSAGKYILYLDADMVLSSRVISECVKKCEEKNIVALYIKERIKIISLKKQSYWTKLRDFERSFYNGTVIDCARFLRKDKFLELGGFDLSLTGPEDWDFDRRIKSLGRTGITEAEFYHNDGISFKEYLRKKRYYGVKFNSYIKKWGKGDKIIKKQFGVWYRYLGVFVEKGKWKKLLKHPFLAVGMYSLKIMVGIGYILSKNNNAAK